MPVNVYIACSMSGRDKQEQVARARRVCEIFKEAGINPISPVIEEQVKEEPGKLINSDKERLKKLWQRDKQILVEEAHVMFWDHAQMQTFGGTREYCLNRGVLWKPTVIYVPQGTPTSVAEFEDDAVFTSVHEAAKYIVETWGTVRKRRKWRWEMLKRTVPTWIKRQWLAWR